MIVFGITGHPAAGKDTMADYMITKGFQKYTMGDVLREEMRSLGLPLDRVSMNKYGSERKKVSGNDYLCFEILKRIKGNSVIPGVRSTKEVETFKENLGDSFKMVYIEAPIEKRFEWAQDRNREGDNITFEQFKEQEERERNHESGSHEVDRVINISEIKISNDGTKEELYKKVDELINGL